MLKLPAFCALLVALVAPAAISADITGVVRLEGQSDNSNVVVYVDGPVAIPSGFVAPKAKLVNRDKTFLPEVLPVFVHSKMEVSNEDDLFHNTYSVSPSNKFDIPLRRKGDSGEVELANPGRVDVFCMIHRDMHAVVLVLRNPYFAVTGADGSFEIKDIPAGTYEVEAWQERLGSKKASITIAFVI